MWLESHRGIKDHPKTAELRAVMGWTLRETVGGLHLLWWWCMAYAEDGDLSRYKPSQIAIAMDVPPQEGDKLLAALVGAGWIDPTPYLRIHDWWQYAGPFLRSKYKRSPNKWDDVRNRYVTVTSPPNHTIPNLTKPNHTNGTDTPASAANGFGPDDLMGLWNSLSPAGLPKVSKLTGKRRQAAKARIADEPDRAKWEQAIQRLGKSSFCLGGSSSGWRADFDFLLRPDSIVKILEGKYDDVEAHKRPFSGGTNAGRKTADLAAPTPGKYAELDGGTGA